MKKHFINGFAIIEVLIGSAIISAALVTLLGLTQNAERIAGGTSLAVRASYISEEGLEATRIIRDAGWSTFAALPHGTPLYFYFTGSTFTTTTTPQYIDAKFKRSFVISNVYRNASMDISSSGTLDSNTKKIEVTTEWAKLVGTGSSTQNIAIYLTKF